MVALIPIILGALFVWYLISIRKDKKAKTRIAWMLLIPCLVIIAAGYKILGPESNEALWPFGTVAAICVVWLIALSTQK